MRLNEPTRPVITLWEGQPELQVDDLAELFPRHRAQSGAAWSVDQFYEEARAVLRDLPIVSIGQPEVWPLPTLYAPSQLPGPMRAMADAADYYLVRFVCSFRPQRPSASIDAARFIVHFLPDDRGNQMVAFDLFPLLVSHGIKHSVKFTLSPTLKFLEVEGSLGSADFGAEYVSLEPVVSAAGIGEDQPSWDYAAVRGQLVQGSKTMYALVKATKGMPIGRAFVDLTADVVSDRLRLPVVPFRSEEEARRSMTVRLWG